MYKKFLLVLLAGAALLASACSPSVITSSSGSQPPPVEDSVPDQNTGYQPLAVESVSVEVGTGSPIPVHVNASGTLPNTCAQIEYGEVRQDGANFVITLAAVPSSDTNCAPDALPFLIRLPLNVIGLPAGDYSAVVNGVSAPFQLEGGSAGGELPDADEPIQKNDVLVEDLNINVGVGSPIPVRAVVSGSLPGPCSYLGEIRLHREGTSFFVRLVAYQPAEASCPQDSVPFLLEVPLNIVNLPQGPYLVNVNGIEASFDPRAVEVPAEESIEERMPILVEDVQVQVGVGSPIPVDVVVSGTWPELCSQISHVGQRLEGSHIEIDLLASAPQPDCPPDRLGLPFRIALPLNMLEMPAGTYSVAVNGMETTFDWLRTGEPPLLTDLPVGEPQPVPVQDVQVEVGVGSPIPVDVVVLTEWPGLCSRLARIDQRVENTQFDITLLAGPDEPQCPPDHVGLRMRFSLPLNMVEMQPGVYTVRVNGVEAVFNWPQEPGEAGEGEANIAFVGRDGNVWVLQAGNGLRPITEDAVILGPQNPNPTDVIQYSSPKLSSDGRLLAFHREAGRVHREGIDFVFELWVVDLETGEGRRVMDSMTAGLAWKPGTHLLAYSPRVQEGYFTMRGEVDPDLAQGIWQIDLDREADQPEEIVPPERGYTLVAPVWSPDGRFLSFDEINQYEGRGMFAYYDLENREYVAWEEAIGSYDWSPDGGMIAYDRMVYFPTTEERIYLRERQGDEEYLLSKELETGYASRPVFSPQGDRIAYLLGPADPDGQDYTLVVQPTTGGERQTLGSFESLQALSWTPDGESLVFSAGPYTQEQVIQVRVGDATSSVLSPGSFPDLSN
jgi:Tol biopolymer transport system component